MPYRPDRQLIGVVVAQGILAVHGEPVTRVERVPLDEASQRVLAEDVIATRDVPPFARSMMDGYAVRAADTTGATREQPVTLHLVGTVYSGHVASAGVGAGQCIGIATGAPIPSGADAVVVVEHSTRDGDVVSVHHGVGPRQHVGRAGSDLVAGELAMATGTLLTPARIGVAAAVGRDTLSVFARPRVAILSTGDEIVAPGAIAGPAQIFDSNTSALAAAVRLHGGEPVIAPRTRDDRDSLAAAFDECLGDDLVLFSGGTSVGERDYLLDVIAAAGTVHFEGLLLKPGRPTVFATVAGRPVFGMPGNPVSCLTNMYLLVAPLLRRMARLPPPVERRVRARLRDEVSSPAGRHQIYPVRLDRAEAVPVFKGSGEITSLAHADGYFEIDAGVDVVPAGTQVEVTLF
jgi:molybdopterin molybdotransferase